MNDVQIHPSSDVQSKEIGEGTRIWQYCVVLSDAKIGKNCNICAQVLIESDVEVGDNVTIKSGVQLWDGIRIEDGVFIGPNVTFTNDIFPRSKKYPKTFLETVVGARASIGANATILPGIKIGSEAMIGAGAVVTKNVPPHAIVKGNPGVITGYIDAFQSLIRFDSPVDGDSATNESSLGVGDCVLYQLPFIHDMRGDLSVVEYEKHIPFVPQRCFWVFDVPSTEIRGEHAHKTLHEYLICLKGSISVVLDDGVVRKELVLDRANIGLYLPPKVWRVHYKYSQDAILLAFASAPYDPNDYMRSYEEFMTYLEQERKI
jgi:UDP-2-acetamido-3-amino-2,3-dideoxy-glucuronate N-acetyltransferase